MEPTELTLKWEKFGLSRGLHDMLGAGELVDVTIACQGEFLQAHKTVLAACSQQFRQIFMMNPCQHPVVFMQDVQLPHLQALLSFMYTGEATIDQDELPALLRTAQALRVSGLASAGQRLLGTEPNNSKEKPAATERESGTEPTPSPPPPSKRARRSSGWRESMPTLQQAPRQVPTPPPRTNVQPPQLLHPSDIKLEDEISLEEAEDDWPPDAQASAPEPHFTMEEPQQQSGTWFEAGPSTSGQQPQPGTSQDGNEQTTNSIGMMSSGQHFLAYASDKSQNQQLASNNRGNLQQNMGYPQQTPHHHQFASPQTIPKRFPCLFCPKLFKSKGSASTHQSVYHRGLSPREKKLFDLE